MRRFWYIPAAILLILAVGCFFLGWVQLSLAPDTYGVVFTKTQGFERAVVNPEGVTWRWERIIPGALTLYKFPIVAQSADIPVTGTLPSGEAYAAMAPEKPDFTFEIRIFLLYRLKPEILPGLADTSRLRPDSLPDFYRTLALEISAKTAALAREASATESQNSEAAPGDDVSDLTKRIETEIPKAFGHVEFITITTNIVKVPDSALYRRLRETYMLVASAREEALRSSAARLAAQEALQSAAEKRHERTIAVLEKYGVLLDKHPSLVKFLFLASVKNFSALDLQSLDIMGKLDGLE